MEQNEGLARYERCPEGFAKILKLLDTLTSRFDLFDLYKVEEYPELFILCTHSQIRYPGLGTTLTSKVEELLKGQGFELFATEASSHFSARIFDKLGFETLGEIKHADYLDEETGRPVFETASPHTKVIAVAKKL